MIILIFLIIIEILTFQVIRQHLYDRSWLRYYFMVTFNTLVSVWFWVIWFRLANFRGIYDEPVNVWLLMNLNGLTAAVVIPRFILVIFHFSGVLARRQTGGHIRSLTNTGLIIAAVIFFTALTGSLFERFNFRKENISVDVRGLHPDLEGLKIVQISDLHLSSFYHHAGQLAGVMKEIDEIGPDLLINTGDFVTIGWREFAGFDTILRTAGGRYGAYAVMGNHDFGTYDPYFTEADRQNNVMLMNKLISSSGYKVLNDESAMIEIGGAKVSLSGITTMGRFPEIISGDLSEALKGSDSADLKILLAHDPNFWEKSVTGKTDIDITFSGHTHGMQFGIVTKRFAWSPASWFYPRWNGLYRKDNQVLIVSRGLGVLGFPFRIGMPPDIVVITLNSG
ncbi:MAG: hypothetical protein GT598_10345 [Bacteroidales bacterium]|nr:hypothetical protein [Bacteroidales bacterium]HPM19086.1 metallophosphoesterase [Bacteroidales bacterium]HQG78267.1 metallophosphoesterase [Bacteroidales bacterium]